MRIEGWERQLHAIIDEARGRKYVIGKHDCALFVIAAIARITGNDYGEQIRGAYKTRAGSLRLVAELGRTLGEAVENVTGAVRVGPARCMRGDPVLYVAEDGQEHLGLCVGDQAAVLAEDGLLFISMERIACGWNL